MKQLGGNKYLEDEMAMQVELHLDKILYISEVKVKANSGKYLSWCHHHPKCPLKGPNSRLLGYY